MSYPRFHTLYLIINLFGYRLGGRKTLRMLLTCLLGTIPANPLSLTMESSILLLYCLYFTQDINQIKFKFVQLKIDPQTLLVLAVQRCRCPGSNLQKCDRLIF